MKYFTINYKLINVYSNSINGVILICEIICVNNHGNLVVYSNKKPLNECIITSVMIIHIYLKEKES
ncbi:hypothetical protein Bamy01_12740 [Bacillus amyloliquefaciens]|nr:hypothetical protein Bamy01_12740 [Bacillus amyloliquefaciens]